jgi:hypothetical protein
VLCGTALQEITLDQLDQAVYWHAVVCPWSLGVLVAVQDETFSRLPVVVEQLAYTVALLKLPATNAGAQVAVGALVANAYWHCTVCPLASGVELGEQDAALAYGVAMRKLQLCAVATVKGELVLLLIVVQDVASTVESCAYWHCVRVDPLLSAVQELTLDHAP